MVALSTATALDSHPAPLNTQGSSVSLGRIEVAITDSVQLPPRPQNEPPTIEA